MPRRNTGKGVRRHLSNQQQCTAQARRYLWGVTGEGVGGDCLGHGSCTAQTNIKAPACHGGIQQQGWGDGWATGNNALHKHGGACMPLGESQVEGEGVLGQLAKVQ